MEKPHDDEGNLPSLHSPRPSALQEKQTSLNNKIQEIYASGFWVEVELRRDDSTRITAF